MDLDTPNQGNSWYNFCEATILLLWLLFVIFVVVTIGIPVLLIHESAHVATAFLLGVKVKKVGVRWKGLYTIRDTGTDVQNLTITLAGPAINLLLAVIFWHHHTVLTAQFFLANVCVFVVNILPISGSDGDRAWKCIVKMRS